MNAMISSALMRLNSGAVVARTLAAARRSASRRSFLMGDDTGVMTMRPPSRANCTSVPGRTPAASRIGLGIVT
jgi:hypothetical protein